jgi:hypothetical protein
MVEGSMEASSVYLDSWLSSQLDIPKKLHSGRVMMPREMTPMYI